MGLVATVLAMDHPRATLAPRSTTEIAACCTLASLLEVSAGPKPGNVHGDSDPALHGKTCEQFLAAIVAMTPWHEAAARAGRAWVADGMAPPELHLGPVLEGAATAMVSAQQGGNVLLGHVLLLVPIAAAAGSLLDHPGATWDDLHGRTALVTRCGTPDDVAGLYKGIQACQPGGMGKAAALDVTDPGVLDEIRATGATFPDAFAASDATDSIASEWTTGFTITFTGTAPRLHELLAVEGWHAREAIVQLFMETLAARPDSLVARKNDAATAVAVTGKARDALQGGTTRDPAVMARVRALDGELAAARGRLNPGTTADLVAAAACVVLLCGYRP